MSITISNLLDSAIGHYMDKGYSLRQVDENKGKARIFMTRDKPDSNGTAVQYIWLEEKGRIIDRGDDAAF